METITHTSFVYKWTHLPTGKWYIGSRTAKGCHPDDGYISSSQLVKPLVKQSPAEWQREIIQTGYPSEMIKLETILLESLDAKNNPMSFNQHNGDGKFTRTGVKASAETRKKQSEAIKGDKHPNKGKPGSNLGKTASEETRRKQSEAKLGKKGHPQSKAAREKIGAAKRGSNNPHYGKTPSKETKEKIRQSIKERWSRPTLTCPHCSKQGKVNMTRFHFDNCKHKGKIE
jgi:hypothetical protein